MSQFTDDNSTVKTRFLWNGINLITVWGKKKKFSWFYLLRLLLIAPISVLPMSVSWNSFTSIIFYVSSVALEHFFFSSFLPSSIAIVSVGSLPTFQLYATSPYRASILQKFFKSITILNGYHLMIYGHNRRHKWHRVYRFAEIKADLRHSFPFLLPTPKQNSSKTEQFLLKVWYRHGMNLTYPASSDHS